MGVLSKIAKGIKGAVKSAVNAVGDVIGAVVDLGTSIINGAVNLVGSILSPLMPDADTPTSAQLSGRSVMVRDPIAARKIAYGMVKTSGAIVFIENTNDNKDLHVCVTLAGHEITSVEGVFLGESLVTGALTEGVETAGLRPDDAIDAAESSNSFSSALFAAITYILQNEQTRHDLYTKVTAHFGADDQLADDNLIERTDLTEAHRLQGIAYLYAKLTYDSTTFSNGLPNISALIKGRAVYDPRTSTTVYSDNAALCVLDYIKDTRFGLGATDAEIDMQSFIDAADICDDEVDVIGGGTEKRYTINGLVDTSQKPKTILKDLLTSCNGALYYSNGKFKIKVANYVTPTDSLTLDDVTGSIRISTRVSNQSNFNAVKGVFVSPDDNYQPVDFPSVTSEVFEDEDGGEQRFVDITLPHTSSAATAQRLAKLLLLQNREQITMTVPCNMKAFKFDVGDTLYFTHERMGFYNKVFEVIGWDFSSNYSGNSISLGVNLTLKETSEASYDWQLSDETELTRNNTTLPSASNVTAPAITVADELRTYNEEVVTVLTVDIGSTSAFAQRTEVQAKRSGDADWTNLGTASGDRFELLKVEDKLEYVVRARSITGVGAYSDWKEETHEVLGKTALPSNVLNLNGSLIGSQILLTWDPVTDLDLSSYRIRYSSKTTGATYQDSVSLIDKVSRPATSVFVPAREGTYFVKAVDKLGYVSETPATYQVSTSVLDVQNLNVVVQLDEHPNFDGTFDDTLELDDQDSIILASTGLFDEQTGLFDDFEGLFDEVGDVIGSGYYYFGQSVDLGASYANRVEQRIISTRLDYVDKFDSGSGLFDDRLGDFDGDPTAFDDVDVHMEYRVTNDDPSGSPTWSSWQRFFVADVQGRAFEFRAKLSSTDLNASPQVQQLTAIVDMPDRVASGEDIVSSAGATNITFDNAFKNVPAIGIAAQGMQTGDYYEISSKTRSGFIITFRNSSGTAISRTFDYVAKGYGKEVA